MSPEFERLAGNLPRRRVVIQTIVAAEEPFSFAQLCEMVQKRDPSVSRTTVYRTLRLLRERQLDSHDRIAGRHIVSSTLIDP